jgi:hypothetical protein
MAAAARYEKLMSELLLARDASQTPLHQDVESEFAEKLQELWEQMTDEEQTLVEERLSK